ncbi:FxsA family protein [Catenovulum sp. SM1970]|uniref:FxsA family protein n=1 Tax=Marinifaba aquimaris TaxID=2741323 RepID=UPI001573EC9E|nr:FxsA family protein [Marinifaba aquimaris]NTS75315.1 FxsA family protein [Marinifaba aquimaris]
MFIKLFLLFAVMPILEIALLLEVGDMIGGWTTLAIVILTAFFGAKLVREQGISTIQTMQAKAAQGEMPAMSLVEGLLLLIAGVLLVTPGFITDILGLAFAIPMTRKVIAKAAYEQFKHNISVQSAGFTQQQGFYQQGFNQHPHEPSMHHDAPSNGSTIEGEFQRKD